VCGFEFAPIHKHLAIGIDKCLRDVQGVMVVFGKPERDDYAVFGGRGLDETHLGGVDGEGVFDILG
jgi:hypothetical protein